VRMRSLKLGCGEGAAHPRKSARPRGGGARGRWSPVTGDWKAKSRFVIKSTALIVAFLRGAACIVGRTGECSACSMMPLASTALCAVTGQSAAPWLWFLSSPRISKNLPKAARRPRLRGPGVSTALCPAPGAGRPFSSPAQLPSKMELMFRATRLLPWVAVIFAQQLSSKGRAIVWALFSLVSYSAWQAEVPSSHPLSGPQLLSEDPGVKSGTFSSVQGLRRLTANSFSHEQRYYHTNIIIGKKR